MIIANKILGAEDGFLPKALIDAYPIAAIIADGPIIMVNITSPIMKFFIQFPIGRQVNYPPLNPASPEKRATKKTG